MKIMIPVKNMEEGKYTLADGFHNAEVACLYDCKHKNYEWLSSGDISSKSGNLSLNLKRNEVYTVITAGMPLMALGLFVESGIKVFQAEGSSVEINIKKYLSGMLEAFSLKTAMASEGCGSSCSSCPSSCN